MTIDAPLALGFAAGMLATVNPCGFAMLPAYLSFFLGSERSAERPDGGVPRALAVGAVVSAGFLVLFAVAGMLVSWVTHEVYEVAPWITVVVGAALVAFGVALLAGWELTVRLPKLERGGRTRGLGSMFVFGLSYGIASLGCTLPAFVTTLSGTFRQANVLSGLAVFVAYGLGMTLVLLVLTVAIALARQSLVRGLRRALPYVNRAAGALLVVAGAYVAWYGVVEVRNGAGNTSTPVRLVTGWSADLSNWVDRVGATHLGLILGLAVTLCVLAALIRADQRDRRDPPPGDDEWPVTAPVKGQPPAAVNADSATTP